MPPAEDIPLPADWLSEEDSAATAGVLFAADTIAQFAKLLKLKAVPFQSLLHFLGGSATQEEPSDAVWDIYQGLLSTVVQVRPLFTCYHFRAFHRRPDLAATSINLSYLTKHCSLQDIVEDEQEARWLAYLDRGTLSEVLAQYIRYSSDKSPSLVPPNIQAAAGPPSL